MASSDNLTSFETWAFRPAFDNSWISEPAFTPHKSSSSDFSPCFYLADVLIPSLSHLQGQSVSSSGGGSETETVSRRPADQNNQPPVPKGKITKRRSRASKRSLTTFITADPENFRQMVQQVTGVRFGSGQFPVVKPEPQRAVTMLNRMQASCLTPTLDTSSFLLDHHRQQQAAEPSSAEGFSAPRVVANAGSTAGFDFDGFSSFPTLESWKVV